MNLVIDPKLDLFQCFHFIFTRKVIEVNRDKFMRIRLLYSYNKKRNVSPVSNVAIAIPDLT